eukprot:Phypoly_transcript_07000.p1 GENE.Phypoly_transcript_07000~~Phypoly_transcript_07000.p1  ORF type:complete len:302 (+),score=57.53 Phypoly_transcript_07000:161-1066(+)
MPFPSFMPLPEPNQSLPGPIPLPPTSTPLPAPTQALHSSTPAIPGPIPEPVQVLHTPIPLQPSAPTPLSEPIQSLPVPILLPLPRPISPHAVPQPSIPSPLPESIQSVRTPIPLPIPIATPHHPKRRKIHSESVLMVPQFNPTLTLELLHYPPNTVPTIPVAHTVSVANVEVRVKGNDPTLELFPYCNDFIIKSKFFQNDKRLKIPGDGLAVSTFHMTKDTGVNRNAFWSKETRVAKFCMKILFSPKNDAERRLAVKFQLSHQYAPGRFTAITSWVHLVDLYVCPANCRSTKSKIAFFTAQ